MSTSPSWFDQEKFSRLVKKKTAPKTPPGPTTRGSAAVPPPAARGVSQPTTPPPGQLGHAAGHSEPGLHRSAAGPAPFRSAASRGRPSRPPAPLTRLSSRNDPLRPIAAADAVPPGPATGPLPPPVPSPRQAKGGPLLPPPHSADRAPLPIAQPHDGPPASAAAARRLGPPAAAPRADRPPAVSPAVSVPAEPRIDDAGAASSRRADLLLMSPCPTFHPRSRKLPVPVLHAAAAHFHPPAEKSGSAIRPPPDVQAAPPRI